MGEGLYWSRDGRTAYAEPFDHLSPEDEPLWRDAYHDLIETIRGCLGKSWSPVGRTWRGRGERVVARNGLHEVWLVEDSYARVHVTFGLREGLDALDPLARHWLEAWSRAFFDRLQQSTTLRVRTGPWTSAPREIRRASA